MSALAPEDRKAEGIIADLSVRENIILAMQASRGWLRHLGAREQDEIADRYIELLQHRHAVGGPAGQAPERRQSAEGDPRPLAGDGPAGC